MYVAQFGVLSFSPDEKMLLFVAQRKKPKSKSFFETPKKGMVVPILMFIVRTSMHV